MHTDVVVLAAGKGTEQSNAKVLHQLAGKYLIQHVLKPRNTEAA